MFNLEQEREFLKWKYRVMGYGCKEMTAAKELEYFKIRMTVYNNTVTTPNLDKILKECCAAIIAATPKQEV